ncbi:uncharacterized protein [Callorhinus ursinus]|uniref:uncharacterized protein n=1 Tax=Callorhinus ursinus TaxID=34884 RepID=UPI003CD01403
MSGRAAAGPALSPRPPARRRPLCRARAAGPPRGRPEPARSPQRARRPGSASWGPRLPPAREARELGESRGVRRPGPPRQGVDAPGPARFRFRPGQRSLEALVADADSGFGRPLLGEVRWFHTGKLESGEEERRGGKRSGPRTQTHGPGPVACGHDSAALPASRRVPPPRAGQSTCVSRVTIGFRETPEDEHDSSQSTPKEAGPTVAFGRRSRTAEPRTHAFFPPPRSAGDPCNSASLRESGWKRSAQPSPARHLEDSPVPGALRLVHLLPLGSPYCLEGPLGPAILELAPSLCPAGNQPSSSALTHPGHLSSPRDATRRKAECSNLRPATCRLRDPAKAMLPVRAPVCSPLRRIDSSTHLRGPREGGGRGDTDPG